MDSPRIIRMSVSRITGMETGNEASAGLSKHGA